MATGTVLKQSHDVSIVITDGAALTYTPSLFDGEISISNFRRKQRDINVHEVRGQLKGLRHSGRVYPTFTLTIKLANYTGSVDVDGATETATPGDVFNRLGTWAAATSTLATNLGGTDVHCVDVEVQIEGTDIGDAADHTITLHSVYGVPQVTHAADGSTWVIECTAYEGVTGDITMLEG